MTKIDFLDDISDKYIKMLKCRYYNRGKCFRGDACNFAHVPQNTLGDYFPELPRKLSNKAKEYNSDQLAQIAISCAEWVLQE